MSILIPIAIAAAVGICWFAATRGAGVNLVTIPPFTQRTDNDKAVVVRGWDKNELTKILAKFKETYEKDGYPEYDFAIQQLDQSRFRIRFPNDIHPRLLIFLVNYLHYPFDFDFKSRSIAAVATSTLGDGFENLNSDFGTRGTLYVPMNDADYDVVYMQTDKGFTLAGSFTDLRWKRVDDPRLSAQAAELMEAGQK